MKNIYKLIVITAVAVIAALAVKTEVFADCTSTYGGGETCIYNKRFIIKKEVRLCDKNGNNCSEWKSKVTGAEKGDVIQFRISIKNLSDEGAGSFDNMKMKDNLPDELFRSGGDGLTEYWDNFDYKETKRFTIDAKIDPKEFDRKETSWEKCVVNKASVYWGKILEGSDTATVCYGNGKPTELPKTGNEPVMAIAGLALIGTGLVLKRKLAA